MVPSVAKTGRSFKGAAQYYLHDKRQDGEAERLTSERVAWTETRNVATKNPDLAWKIMAATSIDQDRLKAAAGVKNTGRKSDAHVYAYSLAWHPDEKKNLHKAEMLRAADETLRVLGAQDHQAMFICHRDEPHPHVHIIVNRVHPETGVMLTKSKDFLKLSQWSEAYERERGRIWCEQRVQNNARRAGGDFLRASSPTPRAMEKEFSEARQANDNQAKRVRDEAKVRAAKLSADSADTKKRHTAEWAGLAAAHKFRKAEIYGRAKERNDRAWEGIKEQFRPAWRELFRQQFREQQAFDRREHRLRGKIENAIHAIKHRSDLNFVQSRGFVSAAFNFITSGKARELAMRALHDKQKRVLTREQKRQADRLKQEIKVMRQQSLRMATDRFNSEREALISRQADERQQLKERWRQETAVRRSAFDTLRRSASAKQSARSMDSGMGASPDRPQQFNQAATGQRRGRRLKRTRKRT